VKKWCLTNITITFFYRSQKEIFIKSTLELFNF